MKKTTKTTLTILTIIFIVLLMGFGLYFGLQMSIFGEKSSVIVGARQGTAGTNQYGNTYYGACPLGDGLGWNLSLLGKQISFQGFGKKIGRETSTAVNVQTCYAGVNAIIDGTTKGYCIKELGTYDLATLTQTKQDLKCNGTITYEKRTITINILGKEETVTTTEKVCSGSWYYGESYLTTSKAKSYECWCPDTAENKKNQTKVTVCDYPVAGAGKGSKCGVKDTGIKDQFGCPIYKYGTISCTTYDSNRQMCPSARRYTCTICGCTNVADHVISKQVYTSRINNKELLIPLSENADLKLSNFQISEYRDNGLTCFGLDIIMKKNMTITTQDTSFIFKNENYSINLIIDNPLPAGEYVMTTEQTADTFFGLTHTKEFMKKVNLTEGINNIKSSQLFTDGLGLVKTKVTIGLILPQAKKDAVIEKTNCHYIQQPYTVSLWNATTQTRYNVTRFRRVQNCTTSKIWSQTIPLGKMEKSFTIADSPIFVEKPAGGCPISYVESISDSNLCIRADLKNVSCSITGCPVLNILGKQVGYICSSAGLCVQMVSEQTGCKANETYDSCGEGKKCEVGSGLCMLTQTYQNLVQCSQPSDCVNPCMGKSIACENNKCVYTGECNIENVNCMTTGCAKGYNCNEERGICEKPNIFGKISWYWYALIVLIIGTITYFIVKKKKKRR